MIIHLRSLFVDALQVFNVLHGRAWNGPLDRLIDQPGSVSIGYHSQYPLVGVGDLRVRVDLG